MQPRSRLLRASSYMLVRYYSCRNSVRPSVCLSHACFVTKPDNALRAILIPHETAIILVFWHQYWLMIDALSIWNLRSKWPTPTKNADFDRGAYNVSTVRNSKKKFDITNRKSTTGFPTSYRWSAYVTLSSPKGGLKSDFSFYNKIPLQSN